MRRAFGVGAVLTALLVAGCSSSSSGPAPASSAPASVPVTTPTSSPTPTPSPTPTKAKAKLLSPYEKDPAVKALRAWASQAGHTINSGHYNDAKLKALMTSAFGKTMKNILGGEVGYRYAGPLPFTPVKVTVTSSTQRDVHICNVSSGFSLNPKTGKPAENYKVEATDAGAVEVHGRWLVSKFDVGSFSCAGVKVQAKKW